MNMKLVEDRDRGAFPKRQLDPDCDAPVSREHLLARQTLEEIELAHVVRDPLGAAPEVPFGHLNAAWRRFAARLREGDEVWSFSTPWKHRLPVRWRREGYVAVRGERIGPCFLTLWRKEFDMERLRARRGS